VRFPLTSLVVIGLGTVLPAQGTLELPTVFSDHMVLQRDVAIPVWGLAVPGSEVTVTLAGRSGKTRAGNDGRFSIRLPKLSAGGPHTLVVAGDHKITITDVLVGEVWLGSGQSNMAMTVKNSRDFQQEQTTAKLPGIRMFTVKRASRATPQSECAGDWKVCSPQTVGGFSATAFFFGRKLHAELNVPVGLIHSSWGGTAIEAWTSMAAQKDVAELQPVFAPWRKKRKNWSAETAEKKHKIALARWEEKVVAAKAAKKRRPRRPRKASNPTLDQNHPANLYNGMIAPLIPYAIRGAIWYQGERNARTIETAKRYRIQMPKLIEDWRGRWGSDFAFGIVQLPNFKQRKNDPGTHTAWAVMRESMLKSLAVDHTGLAITIDVGEAKNIHPKDKQSVGLRLAHWALADVYGSKIVASGPLLQSSEIQGGKLVLTFRHAGDRLQVRGGGPVKGFAIAGADRKWHWAQAEIIGDRVTVSHPDVQRPMAVRYAWGDNPDCNLVNSADLPASPFRTDDW
jgi:sialate O-acetylesterase